MRRGVGWLFARAIAQAAAWGLSGVQQAGIGEEDLQTLARVLARAPALRVYAALPMAREPGPERLARPQVQDTQVLLTALAGRDTYRAKGF